MNKEGLLDALRSYTTAFKDRGGYTLDGEKGKRRYHLDAHHAEHDPRRHPPTLYAQRDMVAVGIKEHGVQEGHVATNRKGETHFVKMDDPDGFGESRNELAAYTVLSSLGFRVPHVSVVEGDRPTIASKSLHHGGVPLRPHYDLSPASLNGRPHADLVDWAESGETVPWPHDPRDAIDQRLAPTLALDNDRNAGNVLYDKDTRRWDLDFGIGEGARWLEGMDVFDAEVLRNRLHAQLEAHPGSKGPLVRGIARLADPKTERDFDWLKKADPAPYTHLGFEHPHQAVMESLRVIRPDLKTLLNEHAAARAN